MTTSGVYGFVTGFDGDIAWLEIDDNVQIRVARAAIQRRVDTATTASEDAARDATPRPATKIAAHHDRATSIDERRASPRRSTVRALRTHPRRCVEALILSPRRYSSLSRTARLAAIFATDTHPALGLDLQGGISVTQRAEAGHDATTDRAWTSPSSRSASASTRSASPSPRSCARATRSSSTCRA